MKAPIQKSSVDGDQQGKYNQFKSELLRVRAYLAEHNASATMTAFALNIYRPNLCRHKHELQQSGVLAVTHRGRCSATGFKADYLTCDPEKVKVLKGNGSSVEIQFPNNDGI